MTVYFTSDLHLFHRAVAYDRRYGGWPKDRSLVTSEDVVWHNNLLAERWDATVRPDDVVWVLGDLIANNKFLTDALEWVNNRPGTKHIVLGNHDPAHPMHSESHKFEDAYRTAFKSVGTMRKRTVVLGDGSKQTVMLSHFPYEGDGDGSAEREIQYRLRNQGLPILHGHTHSKNKVTGACPDLLTGPSKQIHVGLDAWDYTPVPLEAVVELLDAV